MGPFAASGTSNGVDRARPLGGRKRGPTVSALPIELEHRALKESTTASQLLTLIASFCGVAVVTHAMLCQWSLTNLPDP